MSLIAEARDVLQGVKTITHKDLIETVCARTGKSYESVRGTLIKSRGGVLDGFTYHNGVLIRGNLGLKVNYDAQPKIDNWLWVKSLLPRVKDMVTLGGRYGHCIQVLEPKTVLSYDYHPQVCRALKKRFPFVQTSTGDIFRHTDPSHVLNLDLMGYMCGSLFNNLLMTSSVGHQYVVLTIQGQVGGFRNAGKWKESAVRKYRKYKDKNLRALKDAMQGYEYLGGNFYRRGKRARTMRTTVWRLK